MGSAGGLLMNWEPVTFGQRKATIESARARQAYHEADALSERFQHQINTANAYLDILLTDELIQVHTKNLERADDHARIVKALARSGLRPANDTAAINADLSTAKIELLNAQRLREIHHIRLAELFGAEQTTYSTEPRFFETLPVMLTGSDTIEHPLVRLNASRMMIHLKEKDYLQRTIYPKLSLWGTAYARGSGIRWDGTVNASEGLELSRYNYGAGLVLSVPLLRFASIRPQLQSQESTIRADEEQIKLVKLQLDKQARVATLTLVNALAIARESPNLHRSAELSYRGILSRYNSGLTNYADLVQAQYVLLKAEVELKKTYAEAWKALLYLSAVRGDLTLFLDQLN
jgi:outer membrane protein TolC